MLVPAGDSEGSQVPERAVHGTVVDTMCCNSDCVREPNILRCDHKSHGRRATGVGAECGCQEHMPR